MSRISKAAAVMAGTGALIAGGAGVAAADAGASGVAAHSPGVLSGNVVQVPIHIPVNLCGNSVNIGGLLNPAFGNTCVNASGGHDGGGHNGGGHEGPGGDYGYGR